jgi:hypothetical protein
VDILTDQSILIFNLVLLSAMTRFFCPQLQCMSWSTRRNTKHFLAILALLSDLHYTTFVWNCLKQPAYNLRGPTNYCPRLPGNCPGTARGLPETAWAVWSCFKSLSTCIKGFFKTFSMLRCLRFVAFRRTLFLTHGCCIFVVTWVWGSYAMGNS